MNHNLLQLQNKGTYLKIGSLLNLTHCARTYAQHHVVLDYNAVN